jgi:predicted nucleotidyltransferase
MGNKEIDRKLENLKSVLQQRFWVSKIGYFGSYVHNLQNKDSDIDILIQFSKPIGWEFFDVQDFLEDQLKIKVDLVTENALKPQLKAKILSEVRYV